MSPSILYSIRVVLKKSAAVGVHLFHVETINSHFFTIEIFSIYKLLTN